MLMPPLRTEVGIKVFRFSSERRASRDAKVVPLLWAVTSKTAPRANALNTPPDFTRLLLLYVGTLSIALSYVAIGTNVVPFHM
jgi:hypothetical protein